MTATSPFASQSTEPRVPLTERGQTMMELKAAELNCETSWFVEHHIDSPLKLDLLHFLVQHPNTKFNLGAMGCALPNVRRVDLQQGVFSMEKEGLLKEYSHNGTVFYQFALEPERQPTISMLLSFGKFKLQQYLGFCRNHKW